MIICFKNSNKLKFVDTLLIKALLVVINNISDNLANFLIILLNNFRPKKFYPNFAKPRDIRGIKIKPSHVPVNTINPPNEVIMMKQDVELMK